MSIPTSVVNDYGFETIFAQRLTSRMSPPEWWSATAITRDELIAEAFIAALSCPEKVLNTNRLSDPTGEMASCGQRIVFTSGCFESFMFGTSLYWSTAATSMEAVTTFDKGRLDLRCHLH